MSGVAGANRILRKDYTNVVNTFTDQILKPFWEYGKFQHSGSFYSDKDDFGDIDLIVHFNSLLPKKELKLKFINHILSFSEDIIVPFISEKHKGKRYYNSGEIITVNFPQPNGTVQIDVVFALSNEELEFKQHFLSMSANAQGLLLGLIKISIMVYKEDFELRLNKNEIVEYNLNSSELQLRILTYDPHTHEEDLRDVIWSSSNWKDVLFLLKRYEPYDFTFDSLLNSILRVKLNIRARERIVGVFNSMVSVKSGEVGTLKGDEKIESLRIIKETLL